MANPLKIDLPPGVVKTQSALASAGRYIDCDGLRFWQGKPQKLGGHVALTNTPMVGFPRGMGAWNDLTGHLLLAVGTVYKLYALSNSDWVLNDITPIVTSSNLTNPFTMTNGSAAVSVAFPSHGAVAGQHTYYSGAAAAGGITINGEYIITSVTDANNYVITAAAPATSDATGGGTVSAWIELAPGVQDPAVGYGWGAGAWGADYWGTPRATSNISFTPRYWALDHFGKILLACPMGGSIYSFDPTTVPTPRATVVPNAPTACTGLVTTSDLIVIAYGSNYGGSQNYMQWWACAQGDYTNWDVTAIAGPQGSPSVEGVLQSGTEIVGMIDLGNHITLALTDTSLYAFQFTGSNFVFDIVQVGKENGLSGPLAIVVANGVAYWQGNNSFYMYNGGVSAIPNQNDILEFVNKQIPSGFGVKTVASYNEKYKEVWFEFVSTGQTEPTFAVVYNTAGQFWYTVYSIAYSSAARLTGFDNRTIIAKTDGYIYQMENGLDVVAYDGTSTPQPWSLTTAPMELGDGSASYGTDMLIADNQRQVGNVEIDLSAFDRSPAQATIIDAGSAIFAPTDGRQDIRVSGRQIQAKWSCNSLGSDIRFGVWKVSLQPIGTRT